MGSAPSIENTTCVWWVQHHTLYWKCPWLFHGKWCIFDTANVCVPKWGEELLAMALEKSAALVCVTWIFWILCEITYDSVTFSCKTFTYGTFFIIVHSKCATIDTINLNARHISKSQVLYLNFNMHGCSLEFHNNLTSWIWNPDPADGPSG
jgi:hypothetical protein